MKTRILLACVVLAGCLSCGKPADQPTAEPGKQAVGNEPAPSKPVLPPGEPSPLPANRPAPAPPTTTPTGPAEPAGDTTDDAAQNCLRNIKGLAIGLVMLTSDNDDVLKVTADEWKTQVMPYIKSETMFRCPAEKGSGTSYSLNPKMAGVHMTAMNNPTGTVLLYEGQGGKLSFRHGGRACVAFADSHCRLVSEAEAANLIWKP